MIEDICDHFYEKAVGLGVGHFVWCPVPHLEEVPRILDIERASDREHYATNFSIVQMNHDHFKSKQKLPIKALSLGNTEELLISKAKKRPCLVVSCANTAFADSRLVAEVKGRRHLQDQSMILAPIYGIASPEDHQGFPPVMVARIQAFLYNQFYYLPKTCPKTGIGFEKAGVLRLDRLFPASPNRGVTSMNCRLSNEPLALLLAVLQERFGAAESEALNTVRTLLHDTLPAECRPQGT